MQIFVKTLTECTIEDGMSCEIHPSKIPKRYNRYILQASASYLNADHSIIFSVEQFVHHVSVSAFFILVNAKFSSYIDSYVPCVLHCSCCSCKLLTPVS
jgi:hypothetical protein